MGVHQRRTFRRSENAKTKTTSADTKTSTAKNELTRLAKRFCTKRRRFKPCCATQGANCQYGRAVPARQINVALSHRVMFAHLASVSAAKAPDVRRRFMDC